MEIFPKTISLFASNSDEFISFYSTLPCSGDAVKDGLLVKCEPYSKTYKRIYTSLCLVFSSVIVFSYLSKSFNPIPVTWRYIAFIGFGYLAILYMDSCIGSIWFLFYNECLYIKRWRFILPGYKTFSFNRTDIQKIYYVRQTGFHKSPPTFPIWIISDKLSGIIMTDTREQRAMWITKMLTSWAESSNTQELLVKMEIFPKSALRSSSETLIER